MEDTQSADGIDGRCLLSGLGFRQAYGVEVAGRERDEEEKVVQIHPKKSEYVNMTEALHLWRPIDGDFSRLNSG